MPHKTLHKIKRHSQHTIKIINVLFVLTALNPLMALYPNIFLKSNIGSGIFTDFATNLNTFHNWTYLSKAVLFIGISISITPLILGLLTIKEILRNYADEKIFTSQNAIHYQNLGKLMIIHGAITSVISSSLVKLSTTIDLAPGHRILNISFGTPQLSSIFYGSVIFILSKVMIEGALLQQEQDQTV
jgi:hypothetical protein